MKSECLCVKCKVELLLMCDTCLVGLALSDRSYATLLSLTSDVQYKVCSLILVLNLCFSCMRLEWMQCNSVICNTS